VRTPVSIVLQGTHCAGAESGIELPEKGRAFAAFIRLPAVLGFYLLWLTATY